MPLPLAAFIMQGNSDFNALSGLNQELAGCLTDLKIEPYLINLPDIDQSLKTMNKVLMEYGKERIVAAFSFSGIGMELGEGAPEGNVWQHIQVPFLSWMMDHPCYIVKRNMLSLPAVARIYPSTDYVNFQRNYIKAPGRNIHCRMGAFTHGLAPERRHPKKGETPFIIFAKSLGDTEGVRHRWKRLPVKMQSILNDAADHYWEKTRRQGNVEESVLAAAHAAGLELQNDLPLFCFFLSQIDLYCRWHKGNLLVQELLELPVRIYAKGIEHLKVAGAKATLLRPINYPELMQEYRQALAVISMNPNSDDACHDRVFSAFGSGALPVSDVNTWWADTVPELLPYSYNFRDKLVTGAIEKIMADPEAAANTGWDVGVKMRNQRTFQTAVKETIDWALMQRYYEFNFISPIESYVR